MRKGRTGSRRRSHPPTLRSGRAGVRQAVRPGDHILDRSGASIVDFHVGQRPDQQVGQSSPDERRPVPSLCIHDHEWVVYSTAMKEGWLMLQCVECWAMGTIDHPSEEEWSAAYHAPCRPYRWHEGARVTERGRAAPRVIRAVDGPRCECPSQRTLPAYRGYERVPGGIWVHPGGLSDREKKELTELADFVGGSDLCSKLLPLFIRSCEVHTGLRHSRATHTIIDRIEQWDEVGLHCSPSVTARIIREFATWNISEPRVGDHFMEP